MEKSQVEMPKDFNYIFSQFVPYIEKRSSRYKPNGFGKEDLIQEGMIALFSALSTYKADKGVSFSAYACKCINNRIASFIRGNLSLKNSPMTGYAPLEEEMIPSGDPVDRVIEKEEILAIQAKIAGCLSQKERSVLNFYLEGKSGKDIAELVGTDEKNVQNTLYRVRKKIKRIM